MRYTPLPAAFFERNRSRFFNQMQPNSLAIFHANDIMPTNADGTMPFRQNNDLFYLSGIDQEETILLLYNNEKYGNSCKAYLFLRETSEEIAIWEGHKHTKATASQLSGIPENQIFWLNSFERIFKTLMHECSQVYLNTNEHTRNGSLVETRDMRFIKQCQQQYPLHRYERATLIMHQLRAIKQTEELAALQQACNITDQAFRRVLRFVKPNVMEYEIEAELIHEFIKQGSQGFAYTPIIASGANACVLHYTNNDQVCKDGDLILLDVGAAYGNYNADMTRCIPVNGKFTPRQKQVYEAVLRVMKQAIRMLKVGNKHREYTETVGKLVEEELIQLGLLQADEVAKQHPERPLYKKYFMHGVSHFLGLDVHDVGSFHRTFEAGMLFTCEPGIYIREEGIGIRLENNILITDNEPIDLMANIPIEVEEIEALMKK